MAESNQERPSHIEIVTFSPTDPSNPKNWSRNAKRLNVLMVCILTFVSITGSSIFAPTEVQIQKRYGVGPDVATLGLSLYVLGFAFGPFLCPMGEMYGRRRPYLIAWPLYLVSLAPTAWMNNIAVIIFFRFLAGITGSAPFNNGAAINADLYGKVDVQGQAIAGNYYSLAAFCGPVVGPVVGYFISSRFPDQLWTLRAHLFLALAVYPIIILLPETHGPSILAARAERLRETGHPNAWAKHELHEKSTLQLMKTNLTRPMAMLAREPIVMGATVWTSLSYGILYFSFEAYPIIFIEQHGIPMELAGLPYIPVIIGMLIAVLPYVHILRFFQSIKLPRWLEPVNDPQSPESRMKFGVVACLCIPISSFWLAWTSGPETHWILPALSGVFFGFGNVGIFFTFITYLSNVYTLYTASAGAATLFSRSAIGCILPIVAHNFLERLGTKWGISIFGFISFSLIPIPFLFLRYGKQLRASSRYAQEAFVILHQMQSDEDQVGEKENTSGSSQDPSNAEGPLAGTSSADTGPIFEDGSFLNTSEGQISSLEAVRVSSPTIQPLDLEEVISQ